MSENQELITLHSVLAENARLKAENVRLNGALKLYADPENWCNNTLHRKFENIWLHNADGYDIARAALEGDK